MLIYRLEHPKTGMGPYSRSDGNEDMQALGYLLLEEHGCNEYKSHPGPFDDGLGHFHLDLLKNGGSHGAFFGCPSPESLQEWFKEFWPWLIELGYEIKVYDAKHYQLGRSGKQVAFNINTADRV